MTESKNAFIIKLNKPEVIQESLVTGRLIPKALGDNNNKVMMPSHAGKITFKAEPK